MLPTLATACAALLLLVAVSAVALRQDSDTVREQAVLRVRSNADAAVRSLVRQSDDFKRIAAATADNPSVAGLLRSPGPATRQAAQATLGTLAIAKDAPASFVCDLQGRLVAVYPGQPELLGQDFSFRDWFQGAARTGQPYVSTAYRSAASGHPLVVGVSAPVVDGDRRLGYVVVLWQLGSVRSVADGSLNADGIALTVTDQVGQPLTDALAVDDRGQPQSPEISDPTRETLAGHRVSTTIDDYLAETAPIPGIGWTVTATLPVSTAVAPAETFRRNLLAALGVACAIIVLGGALGMVGARRRLVDRHAAEAEREHLAALFAASPIGIIEGTPDGGILTVNEAMAELLDYPMAELLTMRAGDLAHPDSTLEIAGSMQRVLDGSVNNYTTERLYRASDGSAVPVLVSLAVIRHAHGLPRMVAFVVDQRQQRAASEAMQELARGLAERESFLGTLLDTIPVAVVVHDASGSMTLANRFARTLFALGPGEFDGLPALRLADHAAVPLTREELPWTQALAGDEVDEAALTLLAPNGTPTTRLLAHARPLVGVDGSVEGAVWVARDVTRAHTAEEALRASEARFRTVFDEGLTGKTLADASGRIVTCNHVFAHLMGASPEQLQGRLLSSCFANKNDRVRLDELVATGSGELRAEIGLRDDRGRNPWVRVATLWISDPDSADSGRMLLTQMEDVTARRVAEQRLTELALYDELTGLPNRRLLMDRCEQQFASARSGRASSCVVVMFIDLDGFKAVNDRAGHEAGDELLSTLAEDLTRVLRPRDTLARVGGDEFVVLLGEDEGLPTSRIIAERLGTTIRRQVSVDGASLHLSGSIGIARVDLALEPDLMPEQVLRRADAAMYQAKERGRDRHDVFDAALRDSTEARHHLEQAVREGLLHDRLQLVFQPILEIDTGRVLGAEALMRLSDSEGRILPTLPTIVAAEHAGLIDQVGDRVLDLALRALVTWPEHMTVAVNVSARELTGRDFRHGVEEALRRHGVPASRLVLEITESSILHAGPSALASLGKLRAQGVRVAIDDFGTAYATLENLTVLPVDQLKIDSRFTAGLPDLKAHSAVIHGIMAMAYAMDVPCVVEGIENESQLNALRGRSALGQGWLWGQPRGSGSVPIATPFPPLSEDAP